MTGGQRGWSDGADEGANELMKEGRSNNKPSRRKEERVKEV